MTRASDLARLMGAGGTLNAALSVDTISEKTSGSGVTIDSLNVKDGGIGGQQIGGRRNIIINGAMNVAQRGTSVANVGSTGSGFHTVDRFKHFSGGSAGRLTMSQSTVSDLPGFANALKLDCTTADTSIAEGEYFILSHPLEGQDLQQFKKGTSSAEKFTLSFYVKGNASATYSVELNDNNNSRRIGQTFSVTTSWNRVTLTFDGDTSGVLPDTNVVSLYINFWLHAGSTFTGGTHGTSWASTVDNQRAGNSTSIFDSTDRTLEITGLQLEVGSQATPFEYRSFGEELALCQRYYEKSYDVGTAPATDTSNGLITTDTMAGDTTTSYLAHQLKFRVAKRAAVTLVIYDQAQASGKVSSHVTGVGVNHGQTASTEHAGDKSISVLRASGDAANGFRYHYTADAEL